jgi:hypothetical protein
MEHLFTSWTSYRCNRSSLQHINIKWTYRRYIKNRHSSYHLKQDDSNNRNRGIIFSNRGFNNSISSRRTQAFNSKYHGKFQTARYADVFLARVEDYENESNYSQMAYLSELQTDWDKGTVNISDPIVYADKKTRDADNSSFHEAMHGDHQEQYL